MEGGGAGKGRRVLIDALTPTAVRAPPRPAHSNDLLIQKLVHLCWSLNHYPTISVWEHTFRPREYLTPHLEEIFIS